METLWMNQLASFREMLQKESAALKALLQLEDDKYEALKDVDVSKLMRINSSEEDILIELNQTEKKRKELIILLSKVFHFDPSLTLREIFSYIPDQDYAGIKADLLQERDSIKNLTVKLQTTMQENSEMIHANLEIINLTLNFANRHAQKETYDYRSRKESRDNIYLVNQIA